MLQTSAVQGSLSSQPMSLVQQPAPALWLQTLASQLSWVQSILSLQSPADWQQLGTVLYAHWPALQVSVVHLFLSSQSASLAQEVNLLYLHLYWVHLPTVRPEPSLQSVSTVQQDGSGFCGSLNWL